MDFYVRLDTLCSILGMEPEGCGDRVVRVVREDGWHVSCPGEPRAPCEQVALTDEQGYALLVRGL